MHNFPFQREMCMSYCNEIDQLIFNFRSQYRLIKQIKSEVATGNSGFVNYKITTKTNALKQTHANLVNGKWKIKKIAIGQVNKWNISRENQMAAAAAEEKNVSVFFISLWAACRVVVFFFLLNAKIKWLRESIYILHTSIRIKRKVLILMLVLKNEW